MTTSRASVVLLTLALASMGTPTARSQGAAPTAPGPVAAPGSATGAATATEPASDTAAAIDDETAPAEPAEDIPAGVPTTAPAPVAAPAETVPPQPPPDDAQRANWLRTRATSLVDDRTPLVSARIGVSVVDLATGAPVYRRDPDGRYNLASVTKVITAGAALARLGPGFRWRTAIYAERFEPRTGVVDGDLYVRGRGDPTLGVGDLRAMATALRRAGVRQVRGGLAFDATYFDAVTEPPHFSEQPLERAGFRAPIGAFVVAGNVIEIDVVPSAVGGPAEIIMTPPASEYVELAVAEVATVQRGRTRVRVDIRPVGEPKREHLRVTVSGQLRQADGIWSTKRRVDAPVRLAGEVLRTALAAEGIKVTAKPLRLHAVPPTARVLVAHDSAPLAEVVREMNKTSNNFIAETVLKTLGAETRVLPGPATWQDGLAAVQRWLVDDVGLAEDSFRIGNGSGLFGSSSFTPEQVVRVLAAAYHDFRIGPDLLGSMAVAGLDGTLRKRFAASPGRGRVRAKTGTLESTTTLAGYLAVDGRRTLAFAILVNDVPPAERARARALQDSLLEACIAFLGAPAFAP